jgi:DNA-3-methyladenine glycosylase
MRIPGIPEPAVPARGMQTLERGFFLRGAEEVARDLLGTYIVLETDDEPPIAARIVETEAYTRDDPASHSFRGLTARNDAMFREGGTAYVYLIYGIYECFNVVTGPEGVGEAVLVRAAEPAEGIRTIWNNRFPGVPFDPAGAVRLLSGPGLLTRGLGISRVRHNGVSLLSGGLTIRTDGSARTFEIHTGPRIGITKAVEPVRRFTIRDSRAVSRRVR